MFGRLPVDAVDWETAYALNPRSYDPKYMGADPEIRVVRINPVEGQGVVRIGAFIREDQVLNWFTRKYNSGDDRGPQADFDPEHTRMTMYVDYKNGAVIIRQNPSIELEDGEAVRAQSAVPEAQVWQAEDGSVRIRYSGHDAFVPSVSPTLGTVNGDIVVTPGHGVAGTPGSTGATVDGTVTKYPWMEIYQHAPNGNKHTIAVLPAPAIIDNEKVGPNAGLWVNRDIGVGEKAIAPFQRTIEPDPRAMRGAPSVDLTIDQPFAEAGPVGNAPKAPVYANGGDVRGAGSSIGDKIPAWLSDGEFVMNARSTAVNRPFLQALNADPFFLQKMLASRSERSRSSAANGYGGAVPSGQPATVNISMSNQEDIIGRLKVLALQWELSHS